MSETVDKPGPIIGPRNLISIGVATVILISVVTLVVKFNTWANHLEAKQDKMQADLDRVVKSVDAMEKFSLLETKWDAKFEEMRKYGSENSRDNAQAILKLREAFDLHVETTKDKKP